MCPVTWFAWSGCNLTCSAKDPPHGVFMCSNLHSCQSRGSRGRGAAWYVGVSLAILCCSAVTGEGMDGPKAGWFCPQNWWNWCHLYCCCMQWPPKTFKKEEINAQRWGYGISDVQQAARRQMTHLGWAEMVTQQGRSRARAHSHAVTTGKKSGEDISDCRGGAQCHAVKQGIFLFILSQLCLSGNHFMKL